MSLLYIKYMNFAKTIILHMLKKKKKNDLNLTQASLKFLLSLYVAILDTVDFVHADGRCMFRTCEAEKERVVFQMVRSRNGFLINIPTLFWLLEGLAAFLCLLSV